MPSVFYAENHILSLYAECWNADCRYADCHGANLKTDWYHMGEEVVVKVPF